VANDPDFFDETKFTFTFKGVEDLDEEDIELLKEHMLKKELQRRIWEQEITINQPLEGSLSRRLTIP
jgi:hypothetical protein